ncbi:MAG: hypothetical protein ABIP81_08745 [Terriglobales bacterium]
MAASPTPVTAQSNAAGASFFQAEAFTIAPVGETDDSLSGPITASLSAWRLEEKLFPMEPPDIGSGNLGLTGESSSLAIPDGEGSLADPALGATSRRGFEWGPAIRQSFRLLAFQQGMMLTTDKWSRWSVSHGKFFADYAGAVRGGLQQWDDGDPFIDNYIGHPLMGAVGGFIQVQNDPRGRTLSIGRSKAYWQSRLKAMGWSALYSTQFEIGPVSESSIQNLGNFVYRNCDTCESTRGAGWVDIVVTPTLGTAWLVGEDALDHYVVRRIENKLGRGKWSNFFRSVLNPARVAANLIRLKAPWHRDNRDVELRRAE